MNLRFTLPMQSTGFSSVPVSHMPEQPERWLNVEQMAELHGFSVAKIQTLCRKKIIPAVKYGSGWICSVPDWNRYTRSIKPPRISTKETKKRSRALN